MASVPNGKPVESETFLRNVSQPNMAPGQSGASCSGQTPYSHPNLSAHGAASDIESPSAMNSRIEAQLDQWTHFAVLAIQFDPPADDKAPRTLHQAIQEILTEAEKKHQALWFMWRDDLYGCVLPYLDDAAALDFGRQIQHKLAQTRVETVTIGVTRYPLISFNHAQSLANACKALDHAAFFGPGSLALFDAVSLNISGDQYYQDGDLPAAMTEYRAALDLDPKNVNVINSLGVCLAKQNNLKSALAAFTSALQLDPQEAMATYNAGMIRLIQNKPQEALDYFEKAYALDSQTFEIAFQAGKILADQRQWEKALTYLECAVSINSTSGPAYGLLGKCLMALERKPEAIGAYTKAVKLNPNDATALSTLGTLYASKGENPDICMTFCRQSVALDPENGLFRDRLARLYLAQERWEEALIEFERASALGRDCRRQIEQIRRQMQSSPQGKKCCAG